MSVPEHTTELPAPPATGHPDLVRTPAQGPRIRWAGVVWGALFAALAGAGLWLSTQTTRSADLGEWAVDLPPATLITGAVIALGAVILVAGVVGLLRRAQRAVGDRRADRAPASEPDGLDTDPLAGVTDPQ